MGSVGKIGPNQKMLILSSSGQPVPVGTEGEILIKGPNVFAGYHNNPAATANCMTSDGYFRTGDIGYEDRDGNLYITDRLKELIKYKGFQVAPAELEGLLVSHPKVADVCVVGVEHAEQATELPRAYVVKATGARDTEDVALEKEIRSWIDVKVANHKKLRGGVRFVDVIPKSAAGKILRKILRDQAKREIDGARTKAKL
jgi:acyl-CoA synthetase (AMP-forming)/AMP-acid ligase II